MFAIRLGDGLVRLVQLRNIFRELCFWQLLHDLKPSTPKRNILCDHAGFAFSKLGGYDSGPPERHKDQQIWHQTQSKP
jgi:hypothetical protein